MLVGEYLSEDLLLTLPHRQAVQWPALGFVWTIETVPTAKLDSDTGRYGDSISWDDVTLTYAAYAGLGE